MKKRIVLRIIILLCTITIGCKSQSNIGPTIVIDNLEVMTKDLGKMEWKDALKTCKNLGEGWRLPTIEELQIIYTNKYKIGGFANDIYWSSSKYNENDVWLFAFINGARNHMHDNTDLPFYVRAVRTLENNNRSKSSSSEIIDFQKQGNDKYDIGDYKGALQDYSKAIELNPLIADAYNDRGTAKKGLGDIRGALQDYSKAIELNPKFAVAFNNMGNAKQALGNINDALQDYTRAIELNPKSVKAYTNRGSAKCLLKDYTSAFNDFNSAINLDPTNHEIYSFLGLAKIVSGNKVEGCANLNKAKELGSTEVIGLIEQYCK